MKKLVLFAWLLSCTAYAQYTETFYVCEGGDGTLPETATCGTAYDIADVNNVANHDTDDQDDGKIGYNDVVRFMDDGGAHRAALVIPASGASGTPVTYTAQSGDTPVVMYAVAKDNVGDWTDEGGNLWFAAAPLDVGNLIMNGEASIGVRVVNKVDLNVQGEFWWDDPNDRVYLYSVGNPATFYGGDIECAYRQSIISATGKSYFIVKDLTLKYAGGHGVVFGTGCQNVTIDNLTVSYVGGSYLVGVTRFGNGIEILDAGQDIIISNCTISQTFDEGISVQGAGADTVQDITLSGNTITQCGRGVSVTYSHAGSTVTNVVVQDNTITDSGGGWATPAISNAAGEGAVLDNLGTVTGCVFSGNTINGTASGADPIGQGLRIVAGDWDVYQNWIQNTHNSAVRVYTDAVVDFYYNVVTDPNAHPAIYITSNTGVVTVYNNVFYKPDAGDQLVVHFGEVATPATNLTVRNNVVYDSSGANTLFMLGVSTNSTATLSSNLYYDSDGTTTNHWQGGNHANKVAWEAASGETSSVWSDPLFTDAAGDNFILTGASPAVNVGTNVGLTQDFAGRAVPNGHSPDIGAYESDQQIMIISFEGMSKTIQGKGTQNVRLVKKE